MAATKKAPCAHVAAFRARGGVTKPTLAIGGVLAKAPVHLGISDWNGPYSLA